MNISSFGRARCIVWLGGTFAAAIAACIIPDRDIIVIVDSCGEEWVAATAGAHGYTGIDKPKAIKDANEEWIAKRYCASPAQAEQLADPSSELHQNVLTDIIYTCEQRALELELGDVNCAEVANLAYAGTCYNSGGCDEDPEGETGGETGDETGGGVGPTLAALVPTQEVQFIDGEYVVSALLIDAITADPVGLYADGTTATLVVDPASASASGFEISGVGETNLGAALGLRDGDLITSVAGLAATSYAQLLEIAALLLHSEAASVELVRDKAQLRRHYRRGD